MDIETYTGLPVQIEGENHDGELSQPLDRDQRVRAIIKHSQIINLAAGIELAMIKKEKSYQKKEYKNITQYLEALGADLLCDPSTLFKCLSMGETYIKYNDELKAIGFDETHSVTKLPLVKLALERHPKKEVFENLKSMDTREFIEYARPPKEKNNDDDPYWEERGNAYYLEGERVILVNKNLGRSAAKMLKGIISIGFKALQRKGFVVAVHLNSKRESEIFKAEAKLIRKKIQDMRRKGS